MTDFTSEDLLAILEAVDPVFSQLRFFSHPNMPKQRLYPSVEIDATNPQSNEQSVQLIRYTTRFDVSIFVRYFNRDQDTINLESLERNLLSAIKTANLNKIGKLIIENNTFQRGPIKENPLEVNGIQSICTIYFYELAATVGIIGLQQTIDIGSISGLQIIGETGGRGRNDTRRSNDVGYTKMNKGESVGSKYWEYMYTKANYDIIQSLIDADNEITVTLHEATEGNTSILVKPVYQRESVRYDGQKIVILELEIVTV